MLDSSHDSSTWPECFRQNEEEEKFNMLDFESSAGFEKLNNTIKAF